MVQKFCQFFEQTLGAGNLAFPDNERSPPQTFQGDGVPLIAAFVAEDLLQPVFTIGLRNPGSSATTVTMPETTVHEDNFAFAGEDDVGLAGKILRMETVSKSHGVQQAADGEFRRGVGAFDGAHCAAALFGRFDQLRNSIRRLGSNPAAFFRSCRLLATAGHFGEQRLQYVRR